MLTIIHSKSHLKQTALPELTKFGETTTKISNKVANVRRDIIKNKRLTDKEIHKIKDDVQKDIISEGNDNTSEGTNKGKEQLLTASANSIVGQIFQSRDIVTDEMTEADIEDIKIDELEKVREENLESRTPMLQNVEIKIMKEKILREVGIIQNAEISYRKPLHKIQNNRENQLKICTGNNALKEILKMSEPNLMQLSNVLYAAAKVLTEECTNNKRRTGNGRKKPLWKEKIEKEIEHMRGGLSIISEVQRGVNVKGRKFRKMTKKYQLTSENILEIKEMI